MLRKQANYSKPHKYLNKRNRVPQLPAEYEVITLTEQGVNEV